MSTEIIKFYAEDGVELDGFVNKGTKKTDNVLIEIHGMTSNCFKKREKLIAETVEKIGVDSICFNNRGSEIAKYIKYYGEKKAIAGMAYENVEESYNDILGAIKYAVKLGYKNIYIQGHSLGSTKTVYTYNKMKNENNEYLKYIKGIILLSLVDIPRLFRIVSKSQFLKYALEKEKKKLDLELMPAESFIHPISVKTYLQYTKYNNSINFAKYEYKELNNIDIPLFMRWGNNMEFIEQKADKLVELLNERIKNKDKDISFIDGANHSYDEKEEVLADQIKEFMENVEKRHID